MAKKIAINGCFGGFGLSEEAQRLAGVDTPYPTNEDFSIVSDNPFAYRACARLIQAIETASNPNGMCAQVYIVTIPDRVKWTISEYDGIERVDEVHRSWA